MRRRHLPPVDDVKRTLRRTAALAVGAGLLAATITSQSAVSLATRTRGRLAGVLETIAEPLSDVRSSAPDLARLAETDSRASRPVDGPTTRDELADLGIVPRTYVRGVLRDHGGRMKQRRFVDHYGWTPATVSRLLSDLEEAGAIERYRLGREKVVCLPQDDRSASDARSSAPASE